MKTTKKNNRRIDKHESVPKRIILLHDKENCDTVSRFEEEARTLIEEAKSSGSESERKEKLAKAERLIKQASAMLERLVPAVGEKVRVAEENHYKAQNYWITARKVIYEIWRSMPESFEKQEFLEEHYDDIRPFVKREVDSDEEAARLEAVAVPLQESVGEWLEVVAEHERNHKIGQERLASLEKLDQTPETRLAMSRQAEENVHLSQLVKIGEREIARREDAAKKARREAFEMRCRIHAQMIKKV